MVVVGLENYEGRWKVEGGRGKVEDGNEKNSKFSRTKYSSASAVFAQEVRAIIIMNSLTLLPHASCCYQ